MAMRSSGSPLPYTSPSRPIIPGSFVGQAMRQVLRPQGSGDWLLIYTLGGSGLYRFPGGEFETRAHDVTLFRPDDYHDYRCSPRDNRWDLLFAHFTPRTEWLAWLEWPAPEGGPMMLRLGDPGTRRRVIRSLREMVRHFRGAQLRRESFSLHALAEALLWCDAANPRRKESPIDARVARAMDSICEHLALPYSEARLAKASGISTSRLRHLFRGQIGQSIREFHELQRLEQARHLLTLSGQTIGEIADELGFNNPFYFSLRFKKWTGESPRTFRRRATGA